MVQETKNTMIDVALRVPAKKPWHIFGELVAEPPIQLTTEEHAVDGYKEDMTGYMSIMQNGKPDSR